MNDTRMIVSARGIGVLLAALAGALWASAVDAQKVKVYKFVAPDGTVTYSARPPEAAEAVRELEIRPGESIEEAKARRAAEAKAREEFEKAREEALRQAANDLSLAQNALAEARYFRETDWVEVDGNRILGPEYHQRVQAAEAAVAEAERRLEEVRARYATPPEDAARAE